MSTWKITQDSAISVEDPKTSPIPLLKWSKIVDEMKLVVDSISGFVEANPHLKFDRAQKVVYVKDLDKVKEKQVTLFCGGGSGHEPAHAGFVGPSFLTAAVCGHVFASPSSSQVLSCLRRVYSKKHGTVVIVKNYTGDILNFGRAIERFKSDLSRHGDTKVNVSMVVVGDDVGVVSESEEIDVGRRGLSGTILVNKIACTAASLGEDFSAVVDFANYTASNVFTVGLALDPASVPGSGLPRVLSEDEVEFGMGIHNEPGFKVSKYSSATEMVDNLVSSILNSKYFKKSISQNNSKELVVLVNNLGAISNLELGLITKEVLGKLKLLEYNVVQSFQGTYMTGLAMPGVSVSILVLPSEKEKHNKILKYISEPSSAPGWINTIDVEDACSQSEESSIVLDNRVLSTPQKIENCETNSAWVKVIDSVYNAVKEKEAELNRLDSLAGDGDCGYVLFSGVKSLYEAIHKDYIPTDNASTSTAAISGLLESSMGGTSGVIYCLFFDGMSQYFSFNHEDPKKVLPVSAWADAMVNGLNTIKKYSTARLGDRTLIDALEPFVMEFDRTDGDWQKSISLALEGAEKTSSMIPKRGRAVYTGNRSNSMDAGAAGVCTVLQGILSSFS
ncbi:hypothetical protein BB560_005821 [Smittium megazygosporum]|uniref:Dihydroxyacetone kinase n=1 Tax=Smittium megazygosporum TaxID=133381 RepID=A0A2T9YV88_9FUNG|nr:hypothetical protein BB560_005821 [Smittium megazygosporum]